jgi:DNA-binding response OmpR family regulator
MNGTILLIDDDLLLCEMLNFVLTKSGFEVEIAHDARTGLEKIKTLQPDLILLDIMLPDMDGWQACTRLKEMSDIPVIMLTALSSQQDIVKGLNIGADSYIVKPVTGNELAARIQAVLRRPKASAGETNSSKPVFIQGNLVIDFEKHEVIVGNEIVELSPTEFRLLSVLVRHRGHMLPHEFLLLKVWGPEHIDQIDRLRQYISHLRRKLEKSSASKPAPLINSIWGYGYRFG